MCVSPKRVVYMPIAHGAERRLTLMDTHNINYLNELLEQDVELREVSLPFDPQMRYTAGRLHTHLIDQKIKEQVTDLDKKTRNMVGILNKIHSTPSESSQSICKCLISTS